MWSGKNVHLIILFVNSIEGKLLFREGDFFFWVPKPGSNLHAGRDTLALKK